LPEEDTNVTNVRKRKKKKKAIDATINDDGRTIEITIKYDDGSTEKFVERKGHT
jgi:hypothetical protein